MCSKASRLLSSAFRILYRSSSYHTCRILEPVTIPRRGLSSGDYFSKRATNCDEKEDELDDPEGDKERDNVAGAFGEQFRKYRDEDATIIFDVDEEKKKMIDLETINALQDLRDPYEGLNMKRGVEGVFDIEDLVRLLRRDKAKDIFVASVPAEMAYVDYIVVVTGKSMRHMSAIATFVRKVYKLKSNPSDVLPKIEGENSKDWMALDLGNIALHIFSKGARQTYDIETLWTVGSKYDSELNKPDGEEEFAAKYNKFLEGLEPANG